MMRKTLRRGLALLLAVSLILSLSGCVEQYHNGGQTVIEMDENTQAEVESAVTRINEILLEGTLDDLLAQLPEEMEAGDVTNGWNQWETIRQEHGEWTSTENTDIFYYCYAGAATVNYVFEDITMTADMLFTSDHQLVYLDFYESAESAEAEYALPEGLVEETVVIGEGTDYPLEGTLTYPEGGTNLPAVVLVHGIGNNDRDETALSTKMFRDIANGLAERGIAVLRYDKRSHTYPEAQTITDVSTLTIDFQTIDDAVLATELLRQQEMVNPDEVYLVAHDLGGLVAPRIDLEADYAGYVMMASPSRAWSEAAYDQAIRYGMDGLEYDTVQYLEPMLESDIKDIRELDGSEEEDEWTNILLNQYVYYWIDLNAYDYPQMVADSEKPVLIMQGDADYQIETDPDYNGWVEILSNKENATCKLYENVNHMMMEVEGPYTNVSKQYERPLHVAEEVISDLADWILEQVG